MSDITFECGHCNGSLTVEARGAGLEVPCPLCGQSVRIPKPKVVVEIPTPTPPKRKLIHQSQPSYPETKRCPYCAETIQFAAVKCKHCGEILAQELKDTKGPWSGGEMFVFCFLTLIMPLVGLVVGLVGLFDKNRIKQGILLLILTSLYSALLADFVGWF